MKNLLTNLPTYQLTNLPTYQLNLYLLIFLFFSCNNKYEENIVEVDNIYQESIEFDRKNNNLFISSSNIVKDLYNDIKNDKGKIFGAAIVGEQASELIHEWILAIQHDISMFDIMMTQHSFPTISLMNKRVAEKWMMNKTDSGMIPKLAKKFI